MCMDHSNTSWQDAGHVYLPLPAGANGALVGSCPSTIAASSLLLVQLGPKHKLFSHSLVNYWQS